MFKIAAVLFMFAAVTPAAKAEGQSLCADILTVHGIMTRAQFQCGFTRYSTRAFNDAQMCSGQEGERNSNKDMAEGFKIFDNLAKKDGLTRACQYTVMHSNGNLAP